MQKNLIYLIAAFLLCSGYLVAQPQGWIKALELQLFQGASYILPAPDGDFYLVGHGNPQIVSKPNLFAARVDTSGTLRWNVMPDYSTKLLMSAVVMPDGSLAFAGNSYASGSGYTGQFSVIYRYDPNGNHLRTTSFDDSTEFYVYGLTPRSDGGLYVTGLRRKPGTTEGNVFVMTLDARDSVIREKMYEYQTTPPTYNYSHAQSGGDGIILVGVWTLRLDSTGEIVWSKRNYDSVKPIVHVMETREGNVAYFGNELSNGMGGPAEFKAGRIKVTTSNGTAIMETTVGLPGNHTYAWTGEQAADGGYLVAGSVQVGSRENIYLAKLRADGVKEWEMQYSTKSRLRQKAMDVHVVSDGYLLVGDDQYDAVLAKTFHPGPVAPSPPILKTPGVTLWGVVRFDWHAIAVATRYNLQVATDSTFTTLVADVDTITTARHLVTFYRTGRYWWRVRSGNDSVWGAYSKTGTVNVTNVLDVALEGSEDRVESIEVMPNPATTGATVRLTLFRSMLVQVGLFDPLGREVRTITNKVLGPGDHSLWLDTQAIPSGAYVVRARDLKSGTVMSIPVVVVH